MQDIPVGLKKFVDVYIGSIDQLRILLLLAKEPSRTWNMTAIISSLHLTPEIAEKALAELVLTGCIKKSDNSPNEYSFLPATEELREKIIQLIKFDQERPVTLIRMVYDRPKSPAEQFSDAFKFKKEQ